MKQKIKHLLLPIMLLCTFGIVLNMAYNLRESQITIVKLKQSHKRSLDTHKLEFEKLMLFSEQLIAGKIGELKKQQSKYEHQLLICYASKEQQQIEIKGLEIKLIKLVQYINELKKQQMKYKKL